MHQPQTKKIQKKFKKNYFINLKRNIQQVQAISNGSHTAYC